MPVPATIAALSTTPASNSPPGTESPTTADDYLRAYAAFIAELRDGKSNTTAIQAQTNTAFTTAGTATAYTLTPSPAITAYAAGQSFWVTFHLASGAAPTLAISGLATPPNLVKATGLGTYVNLHASDIPVNHRSRVTLLSATQAVVEFVPVQRGTNANGEFVRFPDGTQICTGSYSAPVTANVLYATSLSFPAAFIAAPTPSQHTVSVSVTNSHVTTLGVNSVSASSMIAQIFSNTTQTLSLVFTAIGRWY